MPPDPSEEKIQGLKSATKLPSNAQSEEWQLRNRAWWENHPMRYDWKEPLPFVEGTPEYYAEIDRRFFGAIRSALPWKSVPFDSLIPWDDLARWNVLEVGTGFGSHAALLAARSKTYTGIDLTDRASRFTSQRLTDCGLKGSVIRMDAECLAFPDDSFDFVWSWGVIHHSSNPLKALSEIHRVLKPGGVAFVMIYHRSFWTYYLQGTLRGIFQGLFCQGLDLNDAVQAGTDGAIARFYTRKEWTRLCGSFSEVSTQVFGPKVELLPIPAGRVKNAFIRILPDRVARLFLNHLGWGSLLVSRLRK